MLIFPLSCLSNPPTPALCPSPHLRTYGSTLHPWALGVDELHKSPYIRARSMAIPNNDTAEGHEGTR